MTSEVDDDRSARIASLKEQMLADAKERVEGGTKWSEVMVALQSAATAMTDIHGGNDKAALQLRRALIEAEIEKYVARTEIVIKNHESYNRRFFEELERRGFGYGEA